MAQFIRPQSIGLVWVKCWSLITSCNQSQNTSQFKDALKLILATLPEKVIDNAVKDYRKRLQACVSANVEYFEHTMR